MGEAEVSFLFGRALRPFCLWAFPDAVVALSCHKDYAEFVRELAEARKAAGGGRAHYRLFDVGAAEVRYGFGWE